MPLDEQALRKPGFVEGIRVRLGDGQGWSFPRPRLRLVPHVTKAGDVEVRRRPAYAGRRQADLDAMLDAWEGGDEAKGEWLLARVRLAVGLLLDNYDLDNVALAALLPIEDGEANAAMWDAIDDAFWGFAPKASANG